MRAIIRVVTMLIALVSALDAGATAQRTFVASNGSDSDPCSLAAPCRSFGAAIAQTNDGGEVIVLDSAGYGAATITKSVSIIAPSGVYAGISVFSGDGVTINDPNAIVVLRGLAINGQGGEVGIAISAATEVHVENVTVSNMGASGIYLNANAPLLIKDSIVRSNGGHGIGIYNGTATLSNVRSDRNQGSGLYVQSPGVAAVSGGTFNQNAGNGMRIESGTTVNATGAAISRNLTNGVLDSGTVYLDDCSIDGNAGDGVLASGASLALAYVEIDRGRVAANANYGTRASNAYVYITLNGVTLLGNPSGDVDASLGGSESYQNNAIGGVVGGSLILLNLR